LSDRNIVKKSYQHNEKKEDHYCYEQMLQRWKFGESQTNGITRGKSLGKMQKALANGRLPGVLPRAQSPAIQVITNDHARALGPGKFVWGTFPGTTPDNFSDVCILSWPTFQTVFHKFSEVKSNADMRFASG